jgi:hypothetical protein
MFGELLHKVHANYVHKRRITVFSLAHLKCSPEFGLLWAFLCGRNDLSFGAEQGSFAARNFVWWEHTVWIHETFPLRLIILIVLNVVVLTARTVGTHAINHSLLIIKLPVRHRNKFFRQTIQAVWIRAIFLLVLTIIAFLPGPACFLACLLLTSSRIRG